MLVLSSLRLWPWHSKKKRTDITHQSKFDNVTSYPLQLKKLKAIIPWNSPARGNARGTVLSSLSAIREFNSISSTSKVHRDKIKSTTRLSLLGMSWRVFSGVGTSICHFALVNDTRLRIAFTINCTLAHATQRELERGRKVIREQAKRVGRFKQRKNSLCSWIGLVWATSFF